MWWVYHYNDDPGLRGNSKKIMLRDKKREVAWEVGSGKHVVEGWETRLSHVRLVDENISVMPQNRFYRLPGEVTISTEPMCGA